MFEASNIELSSAALRNNLRFIKKSMKPGVRLCSVVKGNAYGHGLKEFVRMSMAAGVDYFAVYSAEEAFILKQEIPLLPDLFIMGELNTKSVHWAVNNHVEFSVFDYNRLEAALRYSKKLNIKAKIHIEIETGMRRTGFEISHIPVLSAWLKKNSKYITFQGLFTHFAGAESQINNSRIRKQIADFNHAIKLFEANDLRPVYNHTACSAALINYPETPGNMVRIGILQYGFWPNQETRIRHCGEKESANPLRRVIRWTTKVMAFKDVTKGSYIGYGKSFRAPKNMKLAIIPVGYSHGYSRNLSNIGLVLINGKTAPVVGVINMNSVTVDISKAGKVEKGDEVVLIGKQKKLAITVSSFSEKTLQLNYELLTRLPMNIPRIVKD